LFVLSLVSFFAEDSSHEVSDPEESAEDPSVDVSMAAWWDSWTLADKVGWLKLDLCLAEFTFVDWLHEPSQVWVSVQRVIANQTSDICPDGQWCQDNQCSQACHRYG